MRIVGDMSEQLCEIRLAGRHDLHAVLSVHRLHAGDVGPVTPSSLEQSTWETMAGTPGLSIFVAELDGRAVGTASSMLMPNITYDCAPTVFIEAVVVVPAVRRRGVATALLHQLIEDARRHGCNKVQLLSHKRHAEDGAHELYTNVGFEPEAEGFRLYLQQAPAAVQQARATGR